MQGQWQLHTRDDAEDARLIRRQRIALRVVAVLGVIGLLALAGRLVQINTAQAAKLRSFGDDQYYSRSTIPARRGTIFDSRGRILAASHQLYGVFADPELIADREATANKVGAILNIDPTTLAGRIRRSRAPRFCWIEHRVHPAEASAIRNARLPGIGLVDESARRYPLADSLGQVLGFVGADGNGLEGIELLHDDWLAGTDGSAWTVRDTRRRAIMASARPQHRREEPRDGGHVVLTIDSVIQGFLEDRLARQVEDFEAERGIGIVMDPRTGDVLAMANYPPFDPGHYGQYRPEQRRNRAVADAVEPGSTFKPFVAVGALMRGVVKPGEVINCQNGLYVTGGRRLHDSHPHGDLTFEQIVIKSSNIGMGILGERLGDTALHEVVTRFGFGKRTGIDFPGEATGNVRPLNKWTSYTKTSIPMGHEIAVSPIQVISAFSAFANGGILPQPRLVRSLLTPEGEVAKEFFAKPGHRVMPRETADYFTRQVLIGVVNGTGTASNAAVDGYQVFGKTGTAEVPYEDQRGYEPSAYLSSFMGGAPAEDPQVVVLVMIRKPNARRGYYGGIVSAPVVGDVLAATLAYLQVPPQSQEDPSLTE